MQVLHFNIGIAVIFATWIGGVEDPFSRDFDKQKFDLFAGSLFRLKS